jgi:tetratricopeptide (TPR) repeat protein
MIMALEHLDSYLSDGQRKVDAAQRSGIHTEKGVIYLFMDKPDLAIEELDRAYQESQKTETFEETRERMRRDYLFWYALGLIQKGDFAEAQEAIDEYPTLFPEVFSKRRDCFTDFLQGRLELQKGNTADALNHLEEAVSSLIGVNFNNTWSNFHAFFLDALASAYTTNGKREKAAETYEKIIRLTGGRHGWGYIYSQCYYKLGQVYELLDHKGKAIEHYEKFFELWKDADPGVPEVNDARIRLVRLKGN